ncbi:MAG: amino acid adenylation domain-containing protein [Acidobacteriota bacterium]
MCGIRSLHQTFEAQAERTPTAPALTRGERTLTYLELNERANRLARHLQRLGVAPEELAGVCLRRSPEMVVGLLAVLKAGGAYVPLDPAYPRERLDFLLRDSGARVLLTEEALLPQLPATSARVVLIDEGFEAESGENLDAPVDPDNLAYLIHTSGSTGRPKGAAIAHRNAVALLEWAWKVFRPEELAGTLASTSICFDLSVFEIFVPLGRGGRIVLAANALELPRLPPSPEVTLVNTVPTAIAELLAADGLPRSVRVVNLAGEPLKAILVERLYERPFVRRVLNLYGPSEDTTYSTWAELDRGDPLPPSIGGPIDGTRVWLLDPRLDPVPAGEPGELCLGGDGLARGYLGRPDLTAERWIPDPLGEAGQRLYRTGDLARVRPDGRIEFLGRIDHQVKIRGFRVELGEVEAALSRIEGVVACVVVAREDGQGAKRLVAYLAGGADSVDGLRERLLEELPSYMVPSAFVLLEALPLTPNGKVDRKALPEPDWDRIDRGTDCVAPRTPTEELLAAVWSEVLGVARIGVQDDFFALGGDSISAHRIVARVRRSGFVDIGDVADIFAHPTVERLARRLETVGKGSDDAGPALRREPRSGPLPASISQRGLWVLDRLQGGSPAYHVPLAVRLRGALEPAALSAAVGGLLLRHEALRTRLPMVDGEPVQGVAPFEPAAVPLIDLEALPAARREEEVRGGMADELPRPFALETGPLVRTQLFRLDSRDHILFLAAHHVTLDGWSLEVMVRELAALIQGRVVPPPPYQFGDFAVWQRRFLDSPAADRLRAYWVERLRARPPRLELPVDRPRPALQSQRGAVLRQSLAAPLAGRLRDLGRRHGATLFTVLLAAFQTLLARVSGQDDVLVGSPVANRPHPDLESVVGFFTEVLVLRADLSGDPAFLAMLERSRESLLRDQAHQGLPFERVVDAVQAERDPSLPQLFQAMLTLNIPPAPMEIPGVQARRLAPEIRTAKFDLSLELSEPSEPSEMPEGIEAAWEHNRDLFDGATIARLASWWHTLLAEIAEDPARRLSDLPLLPPEERRQLLETGRARMLFPTGSCIHALFEAQAGLRPGAVALVCAGESLTYGELDAKANRLAHHLRSLGVGPEVRVGVCLERSAEMVAALLSVLKAGGAYVPLDPSYPEERLRFMAEDSGARVLVTAAFLEADREAIQSAPATAPEPWVSPDSLAYVIYTSGSTGRPKGVGVTHRALASFLESMRREPGLTGEDTLVALTTIAFDIAALEIFLPLSVGARVVLAAAGEGGDGPRLAALLAGCGATVAQATPVTWRVLLDAGWRAEGLKILCGGEALPRDLADRLLGSGAELWNLYGPTETTVWSAAGRVPPGPEAVRIGGPIANTEIHLLDARAQLVPEGVTGEIYIGGAGLARGYLGRPELTAERFVPHPFGAEPGARLYRTGDLARRHGGAVEVLGRTDHQVKLRGFRIELGEIEAALAACPGVVQTVVVARNDGGAGPRLVAYLVSRGDSAQQDLRELLAGRLPEYMIPSAFVRLDTLPLTANGKVDRRALPAPESGATERPAFVEPRSAAERALAEIWARELGHDPIGIHDNFFDLGGHSLLAIRMLTGVRARFGRDLPLLSVLRAPTVERFAKLLEEKAPAARYSPLVCLQPAGKETPFFCVHPAGGQVLRYVPLARLLGGERPFHALQARGLSTDDEPFASVEEMAACYLPAIRSIQPRGPYLLGGYSLGGLVAYEMACRLEREGEAVSLLALIDMGADDGAGMDSWDDVQVLCFWARLFAIPLPEEEIRSLPADRRLGHALEVARGMNRLPPEFTEADARRYIRVHQTTLWATRAYVPPRYGGRVTLFRGEDEPESEHTLGWSKVAEGGVEVHSVSGGHHTILSMPHIQILAERLGACLAQAAR